MNPDNIVERLRQTIREYEQLISKPDVRERTIQLYLEKHTILIDPSAKDVKPQMRLGTEYITEYLRS